jgi:septum site-determining protein MinC
LNKTETVDQPLPDNFLSLSVQIKGIKEGLLITLSEGNWPEMQESLLKHIEERANFFNGARIALEVGNTIVRAAELGSLRDKLSERGISLWALISGSPTTEQNARMLGLATRLSSPKPDRVVKPLDTSFTGDNAILVERTLRSGFKVTSQGHVVVIGDVNPGAEIVAGGSVVVWGRLRGTVHAGAGGNEQAVVCTLEMAPTQLRIADIIAVSPTKKGKPQPEVARIRSGQVIVESWNVQKEGGK